MVYVIYKYINNEKTVVGYFTKEEKAIEHCLTENEIYEPVESLESTPNRTCHY